MDTTGSLLQYLTRRIGSLEPPILLLVAIVLAVCAFVIASFFAEALMTPGDPVLMAPFRWSH